MKTHRQHFVELLETRDDPEGSSSDTARVQHLLLFADMLDERETVRSANDLRDMSLDEMAQRFGAEKIAKVVGLALNKTTTVDKRSEARAILGLEQQPTIFDATSATLKAHGLTVWNGEERPSTFPNSLVERLASRIDREDANGMKADWARVVEVFLDELTKTPCDLPTDDEIKNALHVEPGHSATIVANLFRAKVAPIVAAQRARIAELERNHESYAEFAERNRVLTSQAQRIDELQRVLAAVEDELIVKRGSVEYMNQTLNDIRQLVGGGNGPERLVVKHRIEELEKQRLSAEARADELGRMLTAAQYDADSTREENSRLRSSSPANQCSNAERAQYELTIDQQKAKIVELEREVARLFAIQADEAKLANEQIDRAEAALARVAELETLVAELDAKRLTAIKERNRAEAKVRTWETRTGETLPRIVEAKLSQPVIMAGETPGQIARKGWYGEDGMDDDEDLLPDWENAASAVLQALGGGVDALRRVRARIANMGFGEAEASFREDTLNAIDAEVARVAPPGPNETRTHKLACTENVIRGPFFWAGSPVSPQRYIHVGHDMSFDAIPAQLALATNDIIEIRVVKRAKQ